MPWLALIAFGLVGFLYPRAWIAAGLAAAAVVAALFANELMFKRKSLGQAILALPGALLQGPCKLFGIARTYLRIATGTEAAIVRSKRAWRARKRG